MIKIENIGKVFNKHSRNKNEVLKGVSFELPDKGLVAIYGKSGSGKTTLLNIIGGLDKQDRGKIYIDNELVGRNVDKIRNKNIGFIFQNYYLEKGYTISEIMHNAMVIAGFSDKKEIEKRSHEVLSIVGMERFKNKQSDALSGGQKQRVAIARALIKGADIILADEPTGNLDAENTIKVMDILKEISKTRLVVIVTHEVTLIKNYADSYIQLVDGLLTDKDVIGEVFEYETKKNNIYLNEDDSRDVGDNNLKVKVYGDPSLKPEDIQIISDNGKIFIKASKNVTVLDDTSEKKLVFKGYEDKKDEKEYRQLPIFEKCKRNRNGKLFTLKNIFKSQRISSDERIYSTANIFKQIFISIIAIVMCFASFIGFEIFRINTDNKVLDKNSVYVNLNTYNDIKKLDQKYYNKIDFFETQEKKGQFSYNGISALSGIELPYTPKAIEENDTKEDVGLRFGKMPEENQVLISNGLAKKLKKELRINQLNQDKAMLLIIFESDFYVSGITNDESSYVYMPKKDYVNFLGVYDRIQFLDESEIFFDKNFINNTYTSEILLYDGKNDVEGIEPDNNEVYIEISRNALYKMMDDTVQADYKVKKANSILRKFSGRTGLEINKSKFYVRKLSITRDMMDTDIRIYVRKEALANIFTYLEPNVSDIQTVDKETGRTYGYYFEINTKDEAQLNLLKNRLSERGIIPVDVNSHYLRDNENIIKEATNGLSMYLVIIVLLYIVYFFIEKSGSIKNSKEYGIYRAIGVKKSNLIFKECVLAIFNNLISYTIVFLIVSILMCVRYSIMNIAFGVFIGILAGVYALSCVLMVAISLIPYLFVLFKTPAEILARYDI